MIEKYKIVKKQLYFLYQLTNKNEVRKRLDDLTKENEKLHNELNSLKNSNEKKVKYEETIKKIFGDDVITLSNIEYTINTEDRISNILSLAKQNKVIKKKYQQTKTELENSKKISIQQKHTIQSLENDISLKNNYIKKLKNIILNSKIVSLIDKLKSVGDNIEFKF